MNFSIIITTFNRKKSLLDCMHSLNRESRNFKCQVLIILNGDSLYLDKYKAQFPNFEFIYTPLVNMSEAKNIGLARSRHDYILFLDDDSLIREGYFNQVNFESNWDVLSGPELYSPKINLNLKALHWSLSSPLCMGPSSDSHSMKCSFDQDASLDLISFGNFWVKRSPSETLTFDQNIYKNEIFFFLSSLKLAGKIFHFNPEIYVNRCNDLQLDRLAKALASANQCRIINFFKEPKPSGVIYFLPLMFNLTVLRTITHFHFFPIFIFTSYSLAVLIYGIFKFRSLSFKFLIYHYFVLFAYSIGTLSAIFELFKKFYNNFKVNNSLINESKTK